MDALLRLALVALAATACVAQTNWTGNYPPCERHGEMLNRDHLSLGVRILTPNHALARQFEHAMEFWSGVLDLDWHRVESEPCSLQLVEGTSELFHSETGGCVASRAQLPDRPGFQGWIAFNPQSHLSEDEMFLVAVHEIGHLLGLPHNPRGDSVMFYLSLDASVTLDASDLRALASRHKLRAGIAGGAAIVARR